MFAGQTVRAYGAYDPVENTMRTSLACEDVSRAIQSQKEEADINTIVRNFGVTGQLPQGIRAPVFGDFETVSDFRSAMEVIMQAEASFMAMPADVRARFQNDPQLFVEFCSDASNLDELRKLGLAPPVPVAPAEPAPPAA